MTREKRCRNNDFRVFFRLLSGKLNFSPGGIGFLKSPRSLSQLVLAASEEPNLRIDRRRSLLKIVICLQGICVLLLPVGLVMAPALLAGGCSCRSCCVPAAARLPGRGDPWLHPLSVVDKKLALSVQSVVVMTFHSVVVILRMCCVTKPQWLRER